MLLFDRSGYQLLGGFLTFGLNVRVVDTDNSVRIENAGFRSVREQNWSSKFSRL
jgi:hypothetical protein